MKLAVYIGLLTVLFNNVSGRGVLFPPKCPGRQLFISRRVVMPFGEIDGGVLVNEQGVIDGILTRDSVNVLLANPDGHLQVIDGGDLALMSGGVDSHVHVNEPGRTSWEGFVTATQAAAAGGFTTIIDMPLNSMPPTTTLENLQTKAAVAREEVFVDVGFWGGVIPGNEEDLQDLLEAGVIGFKCYLIDSGIEEFPYLNVTELTNALNVLNGTGTTLAFHAELAVNTSTTDETLDPELFSTYLASRPDEMELQAVELIAELAAQYDVHFHVVHVSSAGVIPILEKAREARAGSKAWRNGITAETCHHYLSIDAEYIPPGHTEFKCSPPIRNSTNRHTLWSYIKDKRLDLVASDHSPSTIDLKGTDFMEAWGGISSIQFGMSLFWTEASARGLDLSTLSHFLSTGPSKLARLDKRKGALRPGLDADLVFFDPNASFVVTPDIIRYKNKISPYMNGVLRGKVMQTYLRGNLIYSNDELVGGPTGKLLLNF